MSLVKGWIRADESAKEMLSRVLAERPSLVLPPLHRVPLRVGNVVEVVGPSHSAKTEILIQAAVNCILPEQWGGVHYGGFDRGVMFIDLDCRFDILRLSQSLKGRILEGQDKGPNIAYDGELFAACMRRFLYVRCYSSFEFLATLKTMHCRLQKEREARGVSVLFLMIDSIGAFYWVDRGSTSLPLGDYHRKSLSLQSVSDAVVREIRKLLLVHPMLVLATKSTNLWERSSTEVKRTSRTWSHGNSESETQNVHDVRYREFMPSVWQSFVTHRVLVRASDSKSPTSNHQDNSSYSLEWLLPALNSVQKFIVKDAGIWIVA